MELLEYKNKIFNLFNCKNFEELPNKMLNSGYTSELFDEYMKIVGNLNKDWIKHLFQYYQADRINKKQDFTPNCLSSLVSKLSGKADVIYDCCAGTGSLTIEKWKESPNALFICEELDKSAIPFLLFNLAIRNMHAYVINGNVLTKKTEARFEIKKGVKYGIIVNLFRVCRDYPEELAKAINLTPFSRDEFISCYTPSDNPVEQARRTLVRYHQSFGTSNSSKKSWRNVQTYGGPRCATMWNCLPDIIIKCCERLKEAQIENTDALRLIERYNDENTLIYCDPPYLQSLRKKNMYKHEMTDEQHIELLKLLKESNSKIILSGYDNELYNSELTDWNTAEKQTTAQMGLHRTEKLWMNFDMNLFQQKFV